MGSIDKACITGFLCRLCSEMHRTVILIYGDQGTRLCLVEKINGYLPITISPTDLLPKAICETCLRRVEQHYDLLMRLSRIKKERFLPVNKLQQPTLLDVSSTEYSEDDLYNSDEDYRPMVQTSEATGSSIIATSTNASAQSSSRGSSRTEGASNFVTTVTSPQSNSRSSMRLEQTAENVQFSNTRNFSSTTESRDNSSRGSRTTEEIARNLLELSRNFSSDMDRND